MTAPLTPSDCDLRDFAFMPLDAARLLDSDLFALSTGDEFKAAISLWCKSWTQVPAGSLPNDDRVLAHLSGAGARWKKVKVMALRGFVLCNDGRLYHTIVCEKANESWAKKLSYRDRSKKGNAKRWGSQKDDEQQSLKDASAIPKGVLEPPKGQGEGQRDIPLSNDNGRSADPLKIMFDTGIALITAAGKSEQAARSWLGKSRKVQGVEAVIAAIGQASREGAPDPIAFMEGCFRRRQKQERQEADPELPDYV